MTEQLQSVEVVTLFVKELAASRAFYGSVFGAEIVYQDEHSAVLRFGALMINLLDLIEAPMLVAPMPVDQSVSGARFMYTIKVEDVDTVHQALLERGVKVLNGPVDRPWGRRTAAFADPDGFVWEIAQDLPHAAR